MARPRGGLMSWYELASAPQTLAGTGAYSTPFPNGTRILQIHFVGGACTLPTGDGSTTQTITGVAAEWFVLGEHHAARILQGAGAQLQIVFTAGVTAYFVEYLLPAGSS